LKTTQTQNATYNIETITPEYASEVLRLQNGRNRTIREYRVVNLAFAMENGQWKTESNDAICFDTNGQLINGQHRLSAVVLTGKPIEMLVGRNLPSESFSVIDTGAKRTGADFLRANHVSYSSQVSTVGRYYLGRNMSDSGPTYKKGTRLMGRLSYEEVLKWYEADSERIEECCRLAHGRYHKLTSGTYVGLALYHILVNGGSYEIVEEMAHSASQNYQGSLPSNHPYRVLNKFLTDARVARKSLDIQEVVSVFVDCYNDIVSGLDSRRYYRANEVLEKVKRVR